MMSTKLSQRFNHLGTITCAVWLVLAIIRAGLAAGPVLAADTTAVRGAERIAQIVVTIDDPWKKGAEWVHLARSLIYLKEGEQFSPDLLNKSLEALKLSRIFQDIAVDTEQVPQGMRLLFTLKPFHLIKKIRVRDNYPVFEYNIRKAVAVTVGDGYDEQLVEQQKGIIAELYRRQGFMDPRIQIEARQDARDGNYNLDIKVAKGAYYTLNRIVFKGNYAFSQQTLQQKMKTWRQSVLSGQVGRFSPRILEEDIERLIAFYRAKHYPEIQIAYAVESPPDVQKVSIAVTVTEGPCYEVSYEGNKAFSDFRLRRENVIFEAGNVRGGGLRKTVRNLRKRYREAGFLRAKIKPIEEVPSDVRTDVRRIRIQIDEGPQTLVETVNVEGNRVLDDKRIKKQMLTRPPGLFHQGAYVPEVLQEDVFTIRTSYADLGYLDTEVTTAVEKNSAETRAQVRLHLAEGVLTRVASVAFKGTLPLAESKLRQVCSLKAGDPFSQLRLRADADALSAIISEAGYPHVNVAAGTEFTHKRTRVDIMYDVDPGPYVRMGEVFYSGNFRTKARVITREHGLVAGEPFSLRKTLAAQKKIRDMGTFDSVQLVSIGLKDQTDTVHIIAELEEKKPYFFEVGMGYQSDRGFFGRAKAGDRNLWGLNKDFWVGGEVSEIGYRAETALTEPRLFGSRIGATVNAFAEETQEFNQTFGTRIFGSAITFARSLTDHLNAALGFRFEQREQVAVGGTQLSEAESAVRSNLVTTPSVAYDTRNSFVQPRQGVFSEFKVDVSKGIKNSSDDFTKYSLDLRYFTSPVKRLTLAFLGRAGTIRSYGANDFIPSDQLFYLGGTNDVRGYDENLLRYDANGDPVGGQSAVVGSLEARIELGYNLELTTFADTGSVMSSPDFKGDGFRSSFGLGLGYQTIIGPINVLYGWKIDPRPEEAPGRWHFTIGYTF